MIAVIADDLTGAAELGGLGLRYNLKVEIATEVNANTKAELLIISADTRSIKEADAVEKIKKITKELLWLRPQTIYKKIDSVLRGHVVAEIKAQMEVMKLERALIVPANPQLDRIIKGGQYYYKGELIHLSSFSKDPEFPITSSLVTDMLRDRNVAVIKQDELLPSTGITVGEVQREEDLDVWASKVDTNILLAGGSGFFTALLDHRHVSGESKSSVVGAELGTPMLFVCGTTFHKSREAIRQLKYNGGPVSYMPTKSIGSTSTDHDYEHWSDEVVQLLSSNGNAIVAIEESPTSEQANANDLREKMACVVEQVMQKVKIKELVIEGGSTAASIIRKQNFTTLVPVQELSAGVIRMRVENKDGLYLTIKPGSYDWSPELWKF
jgi:D-threonate/D-erythronate kinase